MKPVIAIQPKYLFILLLFLSAAVCAQTEVDGIMMKKKNLCTGFQYTYSSWDHYWEGTFKRDNENLGTVSTQMFAWMGAYGITDKLNVIFGIPYVKTKASAGTLHGMNGFQDLSLTLKWKALEIKPGVGKLSLFAAGGFSFPVSDYVADFQPVSIGVRSKTLTLRAIADYQLNKFFVTGSGAYVYRSNIEIDRQSYYDTELRNTNEVKMPNATTYHVRAGYRGKLIGAEAVFNNWTSLDGFDITKNNFPFPSNKVNSTTLGVALKCNPNALPGLSVGASGHYTVAGRNAGQALTINGSLMYVFDFNRKAPKAKMN